MIFSQVPFRVYSLLVCFKIVVPKEAKTPLLVSDTQQLKWEAQLLFLSFIATQVLFNYKWALLDPLCSDLSFPEVDS